MNKKNSILFADYHYFLFEYMHEKVENKLLQERERNVKEIVSYYTSIFSHMSGTNNDEAIRFIYMLQERLEQKLKEIISTKGLLYWFHLYRRIAPVASFGGESKQTVWLYRNILETAFVKWLFVNSWGGIFLNPAPLLFLPLFLCYD